MSDHEQDRHPNGPDAELESAWGTREALFAIWNPQGQPVTVSWDDSSIITANEQTRSRLTQVHAVAHALLRDDHADARKRLSDMSSLMRAFTALRPLTLASELLWNNPVQCWDTVLADAKQQAVAVLTGRGSDAHEAADALAEAIRLNLITQRCQTILDCVADIASEKSANARLGLGGLGAAVLSAALRVTSRGTHDQLIEEHTALIVGLARGRTVTFSDGRLVIDDA